MTVDEINTIIRVASEIGIQKLKITGGEPLLRTDIMDIVSGATDCMDEVSLTTNGILLEKYAHKLKEAGLNRVNISIDTLREETYQKITGKNQLNYTLNGIRSAIENNLSPIKLNMVVMKGINQSEIYDMIIFSYLNGLILQLIELEVARDRINDQLYTSYHYDFNQLEEELHGIAAKVTNRGLHNRKKYYMPISKITNKISKRLLPKLNFGKTGSVKKGKFVEVEIVKPMHNSIFCENCTRLRITSNGKIKPCLLRNDNTVDIFSQKQTSSDTIQQTLCDAVARREPYWC
jgi:cyclic pyranopterin phosphate synthase